MTEPSNLNFSHSLSTLAQEGRTLYIDHSGELQCTKSFFDDKWFAVKSFFQGMLNRIAPNRWTSPPVTNRRVIELKLMAMLAQNKESTKMAPDLVKQINKLVKKVGLTNEKSIKKHRELSQIVQRVLGKALSPKPLKDIATQFKEDYDEELAPYQEIVTRILASFPDVKAPPVQPTSIFPPSEFQPLEEVQEEQGEGIEQENEPEREVVLEEEGQNKEIAEEAPPPVQPTPLAIKEFVPVGSTDLAKDFKWEGFLQQFGGHCEEAKEFFVEALGQFKSGEKQQEELVAECQEKVNTIENFKEAQKARVKENIPTALTPEQRVMQEQAIDREFDERCKELQSFKDSEAASTELVKAFITIVSSELDIRPKPQETVRPQRSWLQKAAVAATVAASVFTVGYFVYSRMTQQATEDDADAERSSVNESLAQHALTSLTSAVTGSLPELVRTFNPFGTANVLQPPPLSETSLPGVVEELASHAATTALSLVPREGLLTQATALLNSIDSSNALNAVLSQAGSVTSSAVSVVSSAGSAATTALSFVSRPMDVMLPDHNVARIDPSEMLGGLLSTATVVNIAKNLGLSAVGAIGEVVHNIVPTSIAQGVMNAATSAVRWVLPAVPQLISTYIQGAQPEPLGIEASSPNIPQLGSTDTLDDMEAHPEAASTAATFLPIFLLGATVVAAVNVLHSKRSIATPTIRHDPLHTEAIFNTASGNELNTLMEQYKEDLLLRLGNTMRALPGLTERARAVLTDEEMQEVQRLTQLLEGTEAALNSHDPCEPFRKDVHVHTHANFDSLTGRDFRDLQGESARFIQNAEELIALYEDEMEALQELINSSPPRRETTDHRESEELLALEGKAKGSQKQRGPKYEKSSRGRFGKNLAGSNPILQDLQDSNEAPSSTGKEPPSAVEPTGNVPPSPEELQIQAQLQKVTTTLSEFRTQVEQYKAAVSTQKQALANLEKQDVPQSRVNSGEHRRAIVQLRRQIKSSSQYLEELDRLLVRFETRSGMVKGKEIGELEREIRAALRQLKKNLSQIQEDMKSRTTSVSGALPTTSTEPPKGGKRAGPVARTVTSEGLKPLKPTLSAQRPQTPKEKSSSQPPQGAREPNEFESVSEMAAMENPEAASPDQELRLKALSEQFLLEKPLSDDEINEFVKLLWLPGQEGIRGQFILQLESERPKIVTTFTSVIDDLPTVLQHDVDQHLRIIETFFETQEVIRNLPSATPEDLKIYIKSLVGSKESFTQVLASLQQQKEEMDASVKNILKGLSVSPSNAQIISDLESYPIVPETVKELLQTNLEGLKALLVGLGWAREALITLSKSHQPQKPSDAQAAEHSEDLQFFITSSREALEGVKSYQSSLSAEEQPVIDLNQQMLSFSHLFKRLSENKESMPQKYVDAFEELKEKFIDHFKTLSPSMSQMIYKHLEERRRAGEVLSEEESVVLLNLGRQFRGKNLSELLLTPSEQELEQAGTFLEELNQQMSQLLHRMYSSSERPAISSSSDEVVGSLQGRLEDAQAAENPFPFAELSREDLITETRMTSSQPAQDVEQNKSYKKRDLAHRLNQQMLGLNELSARILKHKGSLSPSNWEAFKELQGRFSARFKDRPIAGEKPIDLVLKELEEDTKFVESLLTQGKAIESRWFEAIQSESERLLNVVTQSESGFSEAAKGLVGNLSARSMALFHPREPASEEAKLSLGQKIEQGEMLKKDLSLLPQFIAMEAYILKAFKPIERDTMGRLLAHYHMEDDAQNLKDRFTEFLSMPQDVASTETLTERVERGNALLQEVKGFVRNIKAKMQGTTATSTGGAKKTGGKAVRQQSIEDAQAQMAAPKLEAASHLQPEIQLSERLQTELGEVFDQFYQSHPNLQPFELLSFSSLKERFSKTLSENPTLGKHYIDLVKELFNGYTTPIEVAKSTKAPEPSQDDLKQYEALKLEVTLLLKALAQHGYLSSSEKRVARDLWEQSNTLFNGEPPLSIEDFEAKNKLARTLLTDVQQLQSRTMAQDRLVELRSKIWREFETLKPKMPQLSQDAAQFRLKLFKQAQELFSSPQEPVSIEDLEAKIKLAETLMANVQLLQRGVSAQERFAVLGSEIRQVFTLLEQLRPQLSKGTMRTASDLYDRFIGLFGGSKQPASVEELEQFVQHAEELSTAVHQLQRFAEAQKSLKELESENDRMFHTLITMKPRLSSDEKQAAANLFRRFQKLFGVPGKAISAENLELKVGQATELLKEVHALIKKVGSEHRNPVTSVVATSEGSVERREAQLRHLIDRVWEGDPLSDTDIELLVDLLKDKEVGVSKEALFEHLSLLQRQKLDETAEFLTEIEARLSEYPENAANREIKEAIIARQEIVTSGIKIDTSLLDKSENLRTFMRKIEALDKVHSDLETLLRNKKYELLEGTTEVTLGQELQEAAIAETNQRKVEIRTQLDRLAETARQSFSSIPVQSTLLSSSNLEALRSLRLRAVNIFNSENATVDELQQKMRLAEALISEIRTLSSRIEQEKRVGEPPSTPVLRGAFPGGHESTPIGRATASGSLRRFLEGEQASSATQPSSIQRRLPPDVPPLPKKDDKEDRGIAGGGRSLFDDDNRY